MINIFLATYNGEKYIKEQINSILNQKFLDNICNCSIRLFIYDDASKDDTLKIINNYRDEKIKYIIINNDKEVRNIGSAAAFMKLISFFKANYSYDNNDYFVFSDQDDVWLEHKLFKEYSVLKDSNVAAMVFSDLKIVDENLNIISESMKYRYKKIIKNKNNFFNYLLVENYVTGNTIMFNSLLMDKLIVNDDIYMHDYYLALVCSYIGNIYYVDEPLVLYRQHSNNVLGAKDFGYIKYLLDKNRRNEVKKRYTLMFKQAEYIYSNFDSDENKRRILGAFCALKNKSRVQKMQAIIKNKFFKSDIVHTISMMFNI